MKLRLLILFIFSPVVFAVPQEGTVIKMEFGPTYGDIVHVDMSFDNTTSCANNSNGYDYSFDASTEVGKKIFSTLLAAQRSNSNINMSGMGVCTIHSNTEDIRWMQAK